MAHEADLTVHLDGPIPAEIPTRSATAVFCSGTCATGRGTVERLELIAGEEPYPAIAFGMPRRNAAVRRSGFWAVVPITAPDQPGTVEIRARAELSGGETGSAALASIAVADPRSEAARPGGPGIAICMATFDPDPQLFGRQIASLRAQSETDWICFISDDCSPPDRFEAIEAEISGDAKFVLSRSERRLGFYRNFERALRMVPPQAELVALCDQDDHWYPEKLETLCDALGSAELAYCDARLVDTEGRVLAPSAWEGRRNNHSNLTSLMLTNTITGAASLFRRRIVDLALPFPETPGWQFHDHWLGCVALASGEISYVDRPLYDYVQHGGAVLRGLVGEGEDGTRGASEGQLRGRARIRAAVQRWKARYFYGYMPVRMRAQILLDRCSSSLSPRKRSGLRMLVRADSSTGALARLSIRGLRRLIGRGETLGSEAVITTGILWRRLLGLCTRGALGERDICDATMPPHDPQDLEPAQWRRRQARQARRAAQRQSELASLD